MREAGAKRFLCCVACGLLVAAAIAAWFSLRAPELAPPIGGASRDDAATVEPEAAASHAAATAAAPLERESIDRESGIHVTLLDNRGAPVVLGEGVPGSGYLELHRADAASADGWKILYVAPTTDAQGRLSWAHPGAGRYAVKLRDDLARAEFALAAGESHEVTLQLPPDVVVTTLRFLRDGKLQRGVWASLWRRSQPGGGPRQVARPDRDGVLTLLLRAGEWSVVALRDGVGGAARSLPFVETQLPVPDGQARWSLQLPIAGTSLDVHVVDRDERAIAAATVELHGCTVGDDQPVTLTGTTDDAGLCRWPHVPPGDWRLAVRGDRLRAEPPPTLTVHATDRRRSATVVVERAVVLQLRLHDAFGAAFSPMDAPLPVLSTALGDVLCRRTVGKGTLRDVTLEFPGVVAGAATLRCGDRLVDGKWRLLPFDALPEAVLTIAGGDDLEYALQVEPRAMVDVFACLPNGRERFTATTVVLFDGAPVRSAATVRASHWRGYLPPGDYTVVVTDGAERFERIVSVGRRRLQRRLRL